MKIENYKGKPLCIKCVNEEEFKLILEFLETKVPWAFQAQFNGLKRYNKTDNFLYINEKGQYDLYYGSYLTDPKFGEKILSTDWGAICGT